MLSKRIRPQGEVQLGQEANLVQRPARASGAGAFFDAGTPMGLPEVEYAPRLAPSGQLSAQRLDYSLEPGMQRLAISGDGLVTSYGIFGAPGSGKTHLLMYLMHQVLQIARDNQNQKFGALILDPKAALVDDVRAMVEASGRGDDLRVLNTKLLNDANEGVNVIDVDLDAYELGAQLVMAAQAAGTATSDPYWMLAWGNIFGAALELLRIDGEPRSLATLLEETITFDTSLAEPKRRIEVRADRMRREIASYPADEQRDALKAIGEIENFSRMKGENAETVQSIIIAAYSNFQRSKYLCYSKVQPGSISLYDDIIENGRIVLVSFAPEEPAMAKTACTLVKNLFQRSVLGRLDRWVAKRIRNYERPLVIAADEYSQVACELQGKPVGDGDFFSQSRQHGCMGILATQSVNQLQSSSLKENWKAVFSNLGAKVFMRVADNETAEQAVKLAGESEYYVTSEGTSRGKEGLSSSTQKDLRERKNLPTMVLTQVLKKGEAVVLGSLDGGATLPAMRFLKVPAVYRDVGPSDRKGWG